MEKLKITKSFGESSIIINKIVCLMPFVTDLTNLHNNKLLKVLGKKALRIVEKIDKSKLIKVSRRELSAVHLSYVAFCEIFKMMTISGDD